MTGLREVALWKPEVEVERRPDGTVVMRRADPLKPHPHRITDRMAHWAETAPDRVWMAQRVDGGDWRRVTYAEAMAAIRSLGQAMLGLGLSAERPLMILSGNDIEHALIALAAQHVGAPSAAVSTAYSLVSEDYGKLKSAVEQLTPGLVFAAEGAPFAEAIAAAIPTNTPVVCVSGSPANRDALAFADLVATAPTDAVESAHAAVRPETVAKFLFTSGTTGSPKAVIQTHGMLSSNMAMVEDCYAWMRTEPPVIVDWAPWSHTAAGNKTFNMAIWNGGTFHIDEGKPTPDLIGETARNLREVSPTWYFNVPAGYEMLLPEMERDPKLRESFFRDLKMMMYAAAAMPGHVWRRLSELAVETVGERVMLTTGYGATETGPFALMMTEERAEPGHLGVPAQGVEIKLVPDGDRYECRVRGPAVTPGYWRAPDLTRDAFDEEGFYRLGDALAFSDPDDPAQGLKFAGRTAENFKMKTGTFVAVGRLRQKLVDDLGGIASDAVIAGEDRSELGALLAPAWDHLRRIAGDDLNGADLLAHPKVRAELGARLAAHAAAAGGAAQRVVRALWIETPLSFDRGEITDKRSINQRAVLRNRPEVVAKLFSDDPAVIMARKPRAA